MVAVVGGSKVSTKLAVLERLSELCDQLLVGGGIANTFLAAAGYPVGKSLHEPDLIPTARALMAKTHIPLPLMLWSQRSSARQLKQRSSWRLTCRRTT